jgi:peroxiredoxin Q/BCP
MTKKLALGKPLPDVEVQATGGKTLRLSELKGKPLVVYFYPKDQTPGCTTEGQDFRDHYPGFKKAKAVILGVSRDSLASHEKFKAAHEFPFELVSDPEEKLCKLFGVMKEKQNYGRTYLGVDRSTFIFDKEGILRKEFRGVKVAGHVEQVLEEVRRL